PLAYHPHGHAAYLVAPRFAAAAQARRPHGRVPVCGRTGLRGEQLPLAKPPASYSSAGCPSPRRLERKTSPEKEGLGHRVIDIVGVELARARPASPFAAAGHAEGDQR